MKVIEVKISVSRSIISPVDVHVFGVSVICFITTHAFETVGSGNGVKPHFLPPCRTGVSTCYESMSDRSIICTYTPSEYKYRS